MGPEFVPYWIFVNFEHLPLLAAGLGRIYVSVGRKWVRYKRRWDLKRATRITKARWDALPHVLDEGQNLCTTMEALRAYGAIYVSRKQEKKGRKRAGERQVDTVPPPRLPPRVQSKCRPRA